MLFGHILPMINKLKKKLMNLVLNFQNFLMTLNHLRYRIKHIDDKYPWGMSPNILLVILWYH